MRSGAENIVSHITIDLVGWDRQSATFCFNTSIAATSAGN